MNTLLSGEKLFDPDLIDENYPYDDDCGVTYDPIPEALLRKNYLSEYLSNEEKEKVRANLGIPELMVYKWGNILGILSNQTDLKKVLDDIRKLIKAKPDKAEDLLYDNEEYPNVSNVKNALDYILTKPLDITLTSRVSKVEYGSILNECTIEWEYNKDNIDSLAINKEGLDIGVRSYTLTNLSKTTPVELVVTYNGHMATKSITINFVPAIYSISYSELDRDSLEKISSTLVSSKTPILYLFNNLNSSLDKNTIAGNPSKSQYMYILIPEQYGIPEFSFSGFIGGFLLITDEFNLYHQNGEIAKYRVFRSDNKGLGNTTINLLWQLK